MDDLGLDAHRGKDGTIGDSIIAGNSLSELPSSSHLIHDGIGQVSNQKIPQMPDALRRQLFYTGCQRVEPAAVDDVQHGSFVKPWPF